MAAQNQGIATTEKFKQEYKVYTGELKKPYWQNNQLDEALVQQAYDRLQHEIRAAHILIRVAI